MFNFGDGAMLCNLEKSLWQKLGPSGWISWCKVELIAGWQQPVHQPACSAATHQKHSSSGPKVSTWNYFITRWAQFARPSVSSARLIQQGRAERNNVSRSQSEEREKRTRSDCWGGEAAAESTVCRNWLTAKTGTQCIRSTVGGAQWDRDYLEYDKKKDTLRI